jgi:hypothetical protein
MSTVAEYAIVGLAIVTALNQIGIASTIITILFGGIVLALALAAGLAFGLGGRDTAAQIWQSTYQSSQQAADRVSQQSGNSGGGIPSGGARLTRMPIESGYRPS